MLDLTFNDSAMNVTAPLRIGWSSIAAVTTVPKTASRPALDDASRSRLAALCDLEIVSRRCSQVLAALRDPHRDVALQAFELVQTLIEQHPAARGALLAAGAVKVR